MAEDVMETVGLLQIIEAVGSPDEIADRKAALGKHREKGIIGYQPRHRNAAPAGQRLKPRVQTVEIRNSRLVEPKLADALKERRYDPRTEVRHLPGEQPVPHAMLFGCKMRPLLIHQIVAPDGRQAVGGLGEIGLKHRKFSWAVKAIKNPAEARLGGAVVRRSESAKPQPVSTAYI